MTARAAHALGALAAALALAPAPAGAAPAVHTDLGEVRACAALPGGDALVGTGGGLARVGAGGAVRGAWTAVDGLPGTRVDAIARLGDELWIGAEGGAAQITLGRGALALVRVVPTGRARAVRAIAAHRGARYLGLQGGGVVRVEASGASTALPMRGGGDRAARARVAALAVAGDTLYAGTAAGLFALRDGRLEHVPLPEVAPGAGAVTALHADGDALWIGTPTALLVRDGAGVREVGAGDVRALAALDGALVVARMGAGLARLERGRLAPLPDAPAALALAQVVAGGPDGACAGGLDGLFVRAPDGAWQAATPPPGVPGNDVSALAVDGARVWAGTFDRGLAVHERGRWRALASPHLDHRINALLVVPDARGGSRLWVATATGVAIVEGAPGEERVTSLGKRDGLPARGVLALARLADGRVLAGTMHGAVILGAGRPVALGLKQGLEASNVWAVAQAADGELWLGTTTGVYRGREGGPWTRHAVATGHLRDDWVMALAVRGAEVWVGTYKGGITRLSPDAAAPGGVRATAVADGWINPGGLAWDGDVLRAATMEGLRELAVGSGAWRAVPRLSSPDVTASAVVAGRLWVATRRGVVEGAGAD